MAELHWNLADLEVEFHQRSSALALQMERRAKRRVPGKRHLLRDGEDAHLDALLALRGGIARKNESGLREPGFAGQRLHLGVAQAASIVEDRQLISFQRLGGENVVLHEGEPPWLFHVLPHDGGFSSQSGYQSKDGAGLPGCEQAVAATFAKPQAELMWKSVCPVLAKLGRGSLSVGGRVPRVPPILLG